MYDSTYCPGCGKHCSLREPRCKFGKNYAEKHLPSLSPQFTSKQNKKKRKWEKQVVRGELIWQLLNTSSMIKRAIKNETISEKKLISEFSEGEIIQFSQFLIKLTLEL